MSDLAAASAAMGVPESLVKRSAEARARATGAPVDDILAAWAGGAEAPAAAAAAPKEEAPAPSAGDTVPGPEETPAAGRQTPAETPQRVVEPAAAVTAAPVPTEVSPREALRFPVVVTVPTSGLTERTVPTLPKWLASMLLVIPLFGLLQLAGGTSNDCGAAGELLSDRVTGTLMNCDGSPFQGRGAPGGTTDFIAVGEQIYTGQVVVAANCQSCHGAQGQGGVGPALTTVSATFSSCVDHMEWVAKGTQGFQSEGRPTYGDLNKPVGGAGNMPGFAAVLTPEQIAAVAAFERVRFGGVPEEQAVADCGLAAPPATEGEAPAGDDGEAIAPIEGEAPAGNEGGENPAP